MIRHLLFASILTGSMISLATVVRADTVILPSSKTASSKTIQKNDAAIVPRNIKTKFEQLPKLVKLVASQNTKGDSTKFETIKVIPSEAANKQLPGIASTKTKLSSAETIVGYAFYRYYSPQDTDHFYTANFNELGYGSGGYGLERIEGYIPLYPYSGTVPFYRYYNPQTTSHFYTAYFNEIGYGKYGYVLEGIAGYIYTTAYPGTIPLYRYFSAQATDHFYTIDFNALGYGKAGYTYIGIAGYVYP